MSRNAITFGERATSFVVQFLVVTVPLVISTGSADPFRLPKELLLRGGAVLLASLFVIGLISRRTFPKLVWRTDLLLALSIALWTVITTVTASNPQLAVQGLAYVLTLLVCYLGARHVLPDLPLRRATLLVLVPAVVNGALLLLQSFHLWNPFLFPTESDPHARSTGLIGNPDFAGAYLTAPALVAAAAALMLKKSRPLNTVIFALLFTGVVISRSITAIVALVLSLLILLWLRDRRTAALGAVVLTGAVVLFSIFHAPMQARTNLLVDRVVERDYDAFLSGRIAAFCAAWEMFLDHPLTGVGPHGYGFEFLPYRLHCDETHPELLRHAQRGSNFGEVHNDHLQLLAETGLVGYLLYLASLVLVSRSSVMKMPPQDPSGRFLRLLALPLAASLAILGLAQFPLSLVPVTWNYVFLAALLISRRTTVDS